MHRILLSLVVFLIIPMIVLSNSIVGTVKDETTGQPLAAVAIDIAGTAFRATSSNLGAFSILPLEPGTYRLHISSAGYEAKDLEVNVSGESPSEITIDLRPTILLTAEAIVITAQRYETKPFEVPEAISTVEEIQFSRKSLRSTPEALMGVNGIWMQKTNHGGGSPFIRGLTGNQVLIMIDGVRLNNATFRYGPNQYLNTIAPNAMDRAEIIRGSGSVLYGSDALGGVINILTKSPRFSDDGVNFSGDIGLRYMSQDMDRSIRGELKASAQKWSVYGGLDLRRFGDIVAGGDLGTQAPSGYDQLSGDIKGLFLFSQHHLLTLAYQHVHQEDVPRYDQVAQRGYLRYSFDPQIRQLGYLRSQSFFNNKWFQELQLTLSYHHSLEERVKQKENSTVIRNERDEVDTWGITAEIHANPENNWKIISGIDFYYDLVGSWSKDTDSVTDMDTLRRGLYPDGSSASSLAFFTSHSLNIDRWLFNLGIRFNAFRMSSKDELFGDLDIEPTALVGNVSALFKLHAHHHLAFSINTGFRAPNINDMSSFGSFDYGIEVPSDDLSPERSFTLELGYKVHTNIFSSSLVLYRTQLFDLITRTKSSYLGSISFEEERVYKKENAAEAYLYGVEADFEFELPFRTAAFGHVVYTYGQNETKNKPMRRIPPLYGRLGLRYQSHNGFWAEIDWLGATKQDRLAGGDVDDHRIPSGGTPGWNVLNLRVGYSIQQFVFRLGFQNLFNEAYRLHGSGIDGYGRSFWASVQFGFK